MKRTESLSDNNNNPGVVSPLVDVVFNLMITMFVFLMIYMAVVTPKKDQHLHFMEGTQLPDAAVYSKYHSNTPVAGGSGNVTFLFGSSEPRSLLFDENTEKRKIKLRPIQRMEGDLEYFQWDIVKTDATTIELNTVNGILKADFFPRGAKKSEKSRVNKFDVIAIDNVKTISVKPELTEKWGDVDLFFYQERNTANVETTPVSTDPVPTASTKGEQIKANIAVRQAFSINVKPQTIPFDPKEHPLTIIPPDSLTATVGIPFKSVLSAVGGIEPYEFRLDQKKTVPWLTIKPKTGEIFGTPSSSGSFTFNIELKDAQTRKNSWRVAKLNREEPGNPYVNISLEMTVNEVKDIKAQLIIPEYGRLDNELQAAVVAEGGYGTLTFKALSLPPGLTLNSETGEIKGKLEQPGKFLVSVSVTDRYPNREPLIVKIEQWAVIHKKPKPEIIIGIGE